MSTTVLKMNIHCKGCGNKVKHLLKKIDGVSSVTVDVDRGRVTIVATADPHTLIDTLKKARFKAELVQDSSIPIPENNNLQIVATRSKSDQTADQRLVTQLQQLSQIEDLQNVEVTYSRTIKLNFKGQKDDPLVDNKNNKVVYINGSQIGPSGNNANGPSLDSRGPSCRGHATSHGNGGNCRVCTHNPYGHGNDYWAPPSCGCSHPREPPPLWQRDIPSAPPVEDQTSSDYGPSPPSPSVGYPSYSYMFKDDPILPSLRWPPVGYPSYSYMPQDDDNPNMYFYVPQDDDNPNMYSYMPQDDDNPNMCNLM